MEKIILVGGGNHCESCIDVIEQEGRFNVAGIVDTKEKMGQKVLDYRVIACDEDLPHLVQDYAHFFVTIGHVRSAEPRRRIFAILKNLNLTLPVIISPLAYVSKHACVQEGSIVMPFSMIDINSNIGRNCIINHHTTIGHGAVIGDHSHISANCCIGKCEIGSGTFIGGNSWVTNAITIVPETVVGSASNVIDNIEIPGIYAGNPAKKLR